MQARQIRARARRALKGKWVRMAALLLLASAVTGVLGAVMTFVAMAPLTVSAFHGIDRMIYGAEATSSELTSIPATFFVIVAVGAVLIFATESLLGVGMHGAARAAVGGERPEPRMLFPFRLLGKAMAMNAVRAVLVGVQLLLLIAPGVIALYRYSMADYLLAAHPKLGPIEALRKSRERMKGRKTKLFLLQLSFFGWALLCAAPQLVTQIYARVRLAGEEFTLAAAMRGTLLSLPMLLLGAIGGLFLSAYALTATVIFFQRAERKGRQMAGKPELPAA